MYLSEAELMEICPGLDRTLIDQMDLKHGELFSAINEFLDATESNPPQSTSARKKIIRETMYHRANDDTWQYGYDTIHLKIIHLVRPILKSPKYF